MEAGVVYGGLNRFSLSAYDSATTKFTMLYSDGGDGWTETERNTIDYTHYDDGSGTLATIGNNKYGCHYVYRHIDDTHVYVVLGTDSYTLAEAVLNSVIPPERPAYLDDFGCLIGCIIAPKAGGSFTKVVMVTSQFFSGAEVADHSNLSGLDYASSGHTGFAKSGANDNITSMTGLDDDGIPYAKVYGAGNLYFPDYNEADQGATGNGKSIKAYVDNIGSDSGTIVLRHDSGEATTTYQLSTNETIPSNITLEIENGAVINIASGKTLTINGPFKAGLYQVFSGDGSVSFGSGAVAEVYPEWWGAMFDGTTDDSAALNAAIAVNRHIILPGGKTAAVGSRIDIPSSCVIEGAGGGTSGGTILKWIGAAGGTVVKTEAAGVSGTKIENISIDGQDTADYGLVLDGNVGQACYRNTFSQVYVKDCAAVGIDIAPTANFQASENLFLNCTAIGNVINVRVKSVNAVNNTFILPVFGSDDIAGGTTDYNIRIDGGDLNLFVANFEGANTADIYLAANDTNLSVFTAFSETRFPFLITKTDLTNSAKFSVHLSHIRHTPSSLTGNAIDWDGSTTYLDIISSQFTGNLSFGSNTGGVNLYNTDAAAYTGTLDNVNNFKGAGIGVGRNRGGDYDFDIKAKGNNRIPLRLSSYSADQTANLFELCNLGGAVKTHWTPGGSTVLFTEVSTMTTNENFNKNHGNVFIKDPGGANRNFNPTGSFDAGHVIICINTADAAETITFDSLGLNQAINQNERGIFIYDGNNWLKIYVGS